MRKIILLITALPICTASFATAQPHLSDTSLTTKKITRVVNTYLYQQANENRPEISCRVVPIKHRDFEYESLYGAMQSFAAGVVDSDNRYGKERNRQLALRRTRIGTNQKRNRRNQFQLSGWRN